MTIRRITALYAIIIGTSMIGVWIMFFASGQVPEIKTEPIRISFHLVAEALTAAALLVSGLGLFLNREWATKAYLLSVGMLIYTLIISPGYFAQKGDFAMVGMFAAFLVVAVALTYLLLRSEMP